MFIPMYLFEKTNAFFECLKSLSPEPKKGHNWHFFPQAFPTRLQQQICFVMFLKMGREQEPWFRIRKHWSFSSEITFCATSGKTMQNIIM